MYNTKLYNEDSYNGTIYFERALGTIITSTDGLEYAREAINEKDLVTVALSKSGIISDLASVLNLIELVPEVFHSSQLLVDYIDAISDLFGKHQTDIALLGEQVNPYTVPIEYIQYLGDLLGLKIYTTETSEVNELRRQLIQAIGWYKIKGTYGSIPYIAYLFNLNVEVKDFYTNNYSDFVPEDWFAGEVGENPPGLDSSYYKSPHAGVYIILNNVFAGSPPHLFDLDRSTNFLIYMENTRPVHTVFEYFLKALPITNESGLTQTVAGDIMTRVTENWAYETLLFDQDPPFYFDSEHYFDTSRPAFFSSITKFKLGTGHKGIDPSIPGFIIDDIAYEGTVTSYLETEGYVEFLCEVPSATVLNGISELGLFLGDNTTMVVACTYPDIDKPTGIKLQFLIRVNKGV